jgi:hypothetical protein
MEKYYNVRRLTAANYAKRQSGLRPFVLFCSATFFLRP